MTARRASAGGVDDGGLGPGEGRRSSDPPLRDPLRVVVADDQVPTRVGVRLALEGHGFTVCAEAGNAREAIEAARRERPDVCLIDVHMPGGGGIEAAAAITSELPEATVVMLTISRDEDDLFAAIEAGAVGYLFKDTNSARLAVDLRAAVAGDAPL